MIVALDVDSVLVECNRRNIARLNKHFGTDFEYEEIDDFEYSFLTDEQRDFIYEVCWNDPTQYDEIDLSPEWQAVIESLQDMGFRVIACSSPLEGHIKSKYRFLKRYFDRADIYLCSDKSLVRADILVDDAPHNLEAWPGYAIVYDRPWNQDVDALRAHDPIDVLTFVIDHGYDKAEGYIP